jgi:hypothetical protein
LREAGKTDMPRLKRFLLRHGSAIPRTTLRYAIERFPVAKRAELLQATRTNRSSRRESALSALPKKRSGLASAERMSSENIPGFAIAVVSDQEVLWAEGFGYTRWNRKTQVTADTFFSIQSMSKSFTACDPLSVQECSQFVQAVTVAAQRGVDRNSLHVRNRAEGHAATQVQQHRFPLLVGAAPPSGRHWVLRS